MLRSRCLSTSILYFLVKFAEADVTQIEMSAPVPVYDVSDPTFSWGRSPSPPVVLDTKKLRSIDGAESDEEFSSYLADGSAAERALAKAVSGGKLALTYVERSNQVTAVVTYKVSRSLTAQEVEQLRRHTYGQLVDGAGANFQQEYAEGRESLWIAFEDIEYDSFLVTSAVR